MPANDHLGPQFQFEKATPKSMDGSRNHVVRAMVNGEHAGAVLWNHKSGEVHNITVHPSYQRQGLATGLWHEAKRVAEQTRGVRSPRHSPDRTDAGEGWARSLGERLPRQM